jgi:hypothetical protein
MTALLLELDDAERRLRPNGASYLGVRPIPIARIVGTEGRANDFDRDFRPRRADVRARLRRIADAFPAGDFPPIVATKLGDAYFVVDGHHRVAVARRRGLEWIDAEITERRAAWPLSAAADPVELLHAEQERLFLERSRLGAARPGVRFRFSRPSGYAELLEHVRLHGYERLVAARRPIPVAELAADWYEHAYLPALEVIRDGGLAEACPEATDADRVLYLHQRHRELAVELGELALDDAGRLVADERWRSRPRRRRRRRARQADAASGASPTVSK